MGLLIHKTWQLYIPATRTQLSRPLEAWLQTLGTFLQLKAEIRGNLGKKTTTNKHEPFLKVKQGERSKLVARLPHDSEGRLRCDTYVKREYRLKQLLHNMEKRKNSQVIFIWKASTCSAALRTLTANSRWELAFKLAFYVHLGMNMVAQNNWLTKPFK